MKKVYLLVLSAIFGTGLMAQQATTVVQSDKSKSKTEVKATNTVSGNAKTNTGTIQDELPGFPLFVDTGNPEVDNANYASAKENWIAEHRDQYNKYLQSKGAVTTQSNVKTFTKAEFNNLSEARKTYVLEHPELYSVEK